MAEHERLRGRGSSWIAMLAAFTAAPGDTPLPPQTLAMLMHHYERTGRSTAPQDL